MHACASLIRRVPVSDDVISALGGRRLPHAVTICILADFGRWVPGVGFGVAHVQHEHGKCGRRLAVRKSISRLGFTENLLENTDGVLRTPRPPRSEHPISVLSGWQPAASIYADGRSSDDVIAF